MTPKGNCNARIYLSPALVCALPPGHDGEHRSQFFIDGEQDGEEHEMEAHIEWTLNE